MRNPDHNTSPDRNQQNYKDFFCADMRRTKAREKEIRSILKNLHAPLEKVGLRTGYFQLLVSAEKTSPSKTSHEQYIPFFDVGILPEAVFNLPDNLRDAFAARVYFRSIVANPLGRIIREEFTEIGDTVGAFFEAAKSNVIPWSIPRYNSAIIDQIIYEHGPRFLISLPEHTEPKRARALLREMYADIRAQKDEHYFITDINDQKEEKQVPESDRITYGALLFCALGERLQRDWKSNELKFGYWKPQWEQGAAHFLAVKVLGLPSTLQGDLPLDDAARASAVSLKGRAVLPMITKFKRGAQLQEFFRE